MLVSDSPTICPVVRSLHDASSVSLFFSLFLNNKTLDSGDNYAGFNHLSRNWVEMLEKSEETGKISRSLVVNFPFQILQIMQNYLSDTVTVKQTYCS